MKISKKVLKSIVKECLVEILAEGIGKENPILENAKRKAINETTSIATQSAYRKPSRAPIMNEHVAETISLAGKNDPIMGSIFEDTAKNTLPEMLEGESTVGMTAIDRTVSKHTPEEIFGEDTTSRWQNLAFLK